MNHKKQYIFFCLAKLPLLLLYVSFFIVQLFYNFDIANHPSGASFITFHTSNQQTVNKGTTPADGKLSFRLNKRYHPQQAITCTTVIIKPVVCYVSSKLHVHYSSGFVPSCTPPAHSLRGPPNVV
jgi:hypothetical protein